METIMLVCGFWLALSAIAVGAIYAYMRKQPYGYEDETGFHYGIEPGNEPKVTSWKKKQNT